MDCVNDGIGCGPSDNTGILASDRPWDLPLVERLLRELSRMFRGGGVGVGGHDYCADLNDKSVIAGGMDSTGLANVRWGSGEDVIKCLNTLTITRHDALFTLHNLRYGVAEGYSFTAIAKDSQKTQQSNECGFGIHDVKVDLVGFLDDKIRQFTDGLGDKTAEGRQGFLEGKIPALQFHGEIMDEFNKLNDAHTLYISPLDMFTWTLPICFDTGLLGDRQVLWLCNLHMEVVYTELYGRATTQGSSGDEIIEIDGMNVIEWLKFMVSNDGPLKGFYSDRNQRINQAFFVSDSIQIPLSYRSPPKKQYIDITLSNGQKARVNWLVRFLDYSPSLEGRGVSKGLSWRTYNALVNLNEKFDYVLDIERNLLHRDMASIWNVTSSSGDVEMDKAITPIVHTLNTIRAKQQLPAAAAAESIQVAGGELLNIRLNDKYFHRSSRRAGNEASLAGRRRRRPQSAAGAFWNYNGPIRWKIDGDVAVVVIPTFLIQPDQPATSAASNDEFLYLPVLFEVQRAARSRNVTRILLDLSANSGGYVISSMAALWHFVDSPQDICQPQSKHMTQHWQLWVQSFASHWNESVAAGIKSAGEEELGSMPFLREKFNDLRILYKYASHIIPAFGDFSSELRWIDDTLEGLENLSLKERRYAVERILMNREFIHGDHAEEISPPGGWYPFLPHELLASSPSSGKSADQLSEYTHPRRLRWGPQYSEYSIQGDWTFCREEVLPRMAEIQRRIDPEWQRGYWSKIAILTDGGCGSACSMFAMGLQLYGKATAYTFGGLAHHPMTVSAFTGGNVENYARVWPKINLAAHLGHWATFGQAKWSLLNDLDWVNFATAFPTRATATFNWNMAFHRALGHHALPIQWYVIPSHRHIHSWPRDSTTRQDIYEEIASRDWQADLNNPQYPHLGYCRTHGATPEVDDVAKAAVERYFWPPPPPPPVAPSRLLRRH
ncbi:hypothetical protein FOZ62_026538 [Perkinsus olseni]|uniref:Tail specific protease domain-containing protein n=1 Tax=Perkinsus olseni TaxID=32597 RepID=A0A7J6QBH6_PEROL|nr:hypothetical protein FOZ62_026538 [Perkinsus olseni]